MAKTLKSLTVRGGRPSHRNTLTWAAERSMNGRATKNAIKDAVKALLDTELIESARLISEKNGHVVFSVRESPVIESIEFEGNNRISSNQLFRLVTTEQDKPISKKTVAADISKVQDYYSSRDIPRPTISIRKELNKGNRANLVFVINEDGAPRTAAAGQTTRFRRAKNDRSIRPGKTASDSIQSFAPDEGSGSFADHLPSAFHESSPAVAGERRNGDEMARSASESGVRLDDGTPINSSSWTGQYTVLDHIRSVRAIAPRAMEEIDSLVRLVEAQRFNDPETEAALNLLRSLHEDLGALIEAVEARKDQPILTRIGRKNRKLLSLMKSGAKIGVVAPALTIGISQILSHLTKIPVDSTMVSTVFATMIAIPIIEKQIDRS